MLCSVVVVCLVAQCSYTIYMLTVVEIFYQYNTVVYNHLMI